MNSNVSIEVAATTVEVEAIEVDQTTHNERIQKIAACLDEADRQRKIAQPLVIEYLNIPGNTVKTLHTDLGAVGCQVALKTLQGYQTQLRKLTDEEGNPLIPPAANNAGRKAAPKEDEAILSERIESQDDVLEKAKADSMEATKRLQELFTENKELKAKLTEVDTDLESATAENQHLVECNKRFHSENAELKAEIEQLKSAKAIPASGRKVSKSFPKGEPASSGHKPQSTKELKPKFNKEQLSLL